jgi:hypothetical protein
MTPSLASRPEMSPTGPADPRFPRANLPTPTVLPPGPDPTRPARRKRRARWALALTCSGLLPASPHFRALEEEGARVRFRVGERVLCPIQFLDFLQRLRSLQAPTVLASAGMESDRASSSC